MNSITQKKTPESHTIKPPMIKTEVIDSGSVKLLSTVPNELIGERYCYNCGKHGHLYKNCPDPVTSYGVILYHRSADGELRYLLIQRNFSPEYRSIIHDLKHYFEQADELYNQIDHLTQLEIKYLCHYPYQELFHQMTQHYSAKKTLKFQKNVLNSAKGHQKLLRGAYNKDGVYVKLDQILKRQATAKLIERPLEPDWGFPKGRRNKHRFETDQECAIREVFEETEIGPQDYVLDTTSDSFVELFQGTNGTSYRHIYYLAHTSAFRPAYINPFNKPQLSEIRKIGWYTYEEAQKMFRDYHVEKKKLLERVHAYVNK